jgi:hypothetical protein
MTTESMMVRVKLAPVGLDPRIHLLREKVLRRSMDCRVKPGNDDLNLADMTMSDVIRSKHALI